MDYIERYQALLKAQNVNCLKIGDVLLREYNQIIIPLGPILRQKPNKDIDYKEVFSKLKGKLLWWSYYDESLKDSDWYGVIKDKHLELSQYKTSNTRNQIRKGLKNCEIRKIDASKIVEHGYEIYKNAFTLYGLKHPPDEDGFIFKIKATTGFDDIIHYWGIFIDGKLVGYAVVYLYDKIEANISEIRIDPKFINLYPSYALFHVLSEYYLKVYQVGYLSDGYRNLQHKTNIQDLLVGKFGFKKNGLKINLAIRFPFNILINVLLPFQNIFKLTQIQSVFILLKIAHKQKKLPK